MLVGKLVHVEILLSGVREGEKGKEDERKIKLELTCKYGGIRYSFRSFDWQRVISEVQSIISITENANSISIAAFRIRIF